MYEFNMGVKLQKQIVDITGISSKCWINVGIVSEISVCYLKPKL